MKDEKIGSIEEIQTKIISIMEGLDLHEARIRKLETERDYIAYVDERVKSIRQKLKRHRETEVFLSRAALGMIVLQIATLILIVWR